jgi:hypothetical protein
MRSGSDCEPKPPLGLFLKSRGIAFEQWKTDSNTKTKCLPSLE